MKRAPIAWFRPALWSLLAFAAATSAPGLTAQDKADHVARGKWFEVHSHIPGTKAEAMAKEALKITEAVWVEAGKMYGLPKKRLSNPFRIHLYRVGADYDRVDQVKTRGAMKERGQFTMFDTKETHIKLQQLEEDLFEQTGLIAPDRLAILKESCEICVKSAYDNHRMLPAWFFRGLTGRLRDAVNEKLKFVSVPASDPRESTQLSYVVEVLESGKLPTVEALVTGKGLDGVGQWAHEALYESLYRFLCDKHWKVMRAYQRSSEKFPGSNSLPEKMEKLFRAKMRKVWASLDADFSAWLQSIEPVWQEDYKSIWEVEDGLMQVAATQDDARVWRFREPKAKTYSITGSFELLQTKKPGVAFLLDRHIDRNPDSWSEKFLYIGVEASGTVFAQNYSYDVRKPDAQAWSDIGQSTATFAAGKPIQFRLVVGEDTVTLSLDGSDVLVVSSEGHDMTGQWGIGMRAGSAGTWRAVKLADAP